jgi:hypothetical protein
VPDARRADPDRCRPDQLLYASEKGAGKFDGGDGFADVRKQGFFAWEYNGKRKDLRAAHRQLVDYKDSLENSPLLVVSDLDRIEVRANFTGLSPRTDTRRCVSPVSRPRQRGFRWIRAQHSLLVSIDRARGPQAP